MRVAKNKFKGAITELVLAQMQGKVIQEQQAIINRQQTQIDSILSRLLALESK